MQWRADMAPRKWPDKSPEELLQRRKALKDAWATDGLQLNFSGPELQPHGKVGNTVDAQRLMMHARAQGRENEMIEAVYTTANHVHNKCLSDWSVLTEASSDAGVDGVMEMLSSDFGIAEHAAKVQHYRDIGINAVPVIVIQDKYPVFGAPSTDMLVAAFTELIETGAIIN